MESEFRIRHNKAGPRFIFTAKDEKRAGWFLVLEPLNDEEVQMFVVIEEESGLVQSPQIAIPKGTLEIAVKLLCAHKGDDDEKA